MNSAARLVFSASRYSMMRTVSRSSSCTDWRCRSGSSSSWLFWHTDAYDQTAPPYLAEEFHQSFARQRFPLCFVAFSSHAPIVQPSAIELFRLLLRDCGTLCRWTSRQHRQYLFSGNIWRPISSVILFLNLLCLYSDFVISDTIINLLLTY